MVLQSKARCYNKEGKNLTHPAWASWKLRSHRSWAYRAPKRSEELEVHSFSRLALSTWLTLCTPSKRVALVSIVTLNMYYGVDIVLTTYLHLYIREGN